MSSIAILPPLPPLVPGALDADLPPGRIDDPAARASVEATRADPTVVRPLEVKRVRTPAATFEALLGDLPRTARLVETIGAGRYRIEAIAGGKLRIEDGAGARAVVDTVVSRPGERVYRAVGGLHLPGVPEIRGTGVVALRYEERDGAVWTGGQIHFRLESRWLHALARPIVRILRRVIDAKVGQLVDAAIAVCEHQGT